MKLAMAQMLVEGGRLESNLKRAVEMIHEAAHQGCRMVLLPECLDLGWTHPAARELAHPVPGPHSDTLCEAARQASIWVVAGLTERWGGQIYNAAVLIAADGALVLKHRKINILDIAQDLYTPGCSLATARTPWGMVGVNICADNFPQSLWIGRALGRMGATLLLSPCAWAVDADHDQQQDPYGSLWREAYGRLGKEHGMTVVGVSNVGRLEAGPWAGRLCIGCSMAVSAGGVLAEAPYGADAEALVSVEV